MSFPKIYNTFSEPLKEKIEKSLDNILMSDILKKPNHTKIMQNHFLKEYSEATSQANLLGIDCTSYDDILKEEFPEMDLTSIREKRKKAYLKTYN